MRANCKDTRGKQKVSSFQLELMKWNFQITGTKFLIFTVAAFDILVILMSYDGTGYHASGER
jgi:hypothetical protein